jgi:acyl-CoA synthetase (AMP-forming)/AMP-acid ligase II
MLTGHDQPDGGAKVVVAQDYTLRGLLDRQAGERPDQVAIAKLAGAGVQASLTYLRLRDDARALAAWLAAGAALRPGDRVAILLDNASVLEFYLVIAACWTGGFVAVPLNARLAPPEIVDQVVRSEATILVTAQGFAAKFARTDLTLSGVLDVDAGDGWPWPAVGLHAAVDSGRELREPPAPVPDAPCDLIFTSGTTGRTKGALFRHRQCLAQGRLVGEGLRLDEHVRLMLSVPIYTSTGIHTFPLPCLTQGATILYEDGFDGAAWSARARATGPTHYFGVPSMLALILDQTDASEIATVSTLRTVMFGGSPMPPPLAERLLAAFPGLQLWNIHGLTEAGPIGTALRPEDALRKPYTVGTPLPGTEVRVVGTEGSLLTAGTPGEVLLRAASVMARYLDDPVATAAAIDGDGWLHTGAIGRVDDEGFLTVLDRKHDMIVRGRFNVYRAEVEQVFVAHPDVLEAAVFGVPHPVLGEDVVACVVLREGAWTTPEELADFCREHVADYKAPRTVRLLEALPRNAMGKVCAGSSDRDRDRRGERGRVRSAARRPRRASGPDRENRRLHRRGDNAARARAHAVLRPPARVRPHRLRERRAARRVARVTPGDAPPR